MTNISELIDRRLDAERGTIFKHAKRSVALVYPSPYPIGMASLGFQTVYRRLNDLPDTAAERAFLPDDELEESSPLLTYETKRPAGDFDVIAFSVAYELELLGMFTCLKRMGLNPLRDERHKRDPWVIVGGPMTFSNPLPLAPFADAIVLGEAEDVLGPLLDVLYSGASREETLRSIADIPGMFVPSLHGEEIPPIARCEDTELPAVSSIVTPESVLSNIFLIEPERGCSRGCSFCVMRRSTNGGMRLVSPEKIAELIPDYAQRVGLVGAAVTDHPKIVDIVRHVVESGRGVGISSMRADRLTPEFVELLMKGGYKTLTVASDGASERLRIDLEKKIRERHLLRTGELVKEYRIPKLKLYMMVGVPGETDEDLDELIDFGARLKKTVGSQVGLALGLATFVAKRNTPLDGAPFVGINESDRRIRKLRKSLRGVMEVRPSSSRWAWVEYELSQGTAAAGLAAHEAWQHGGRFAEWKKALGRHRPASAAAPSGLPIVGQLAQ